MSRRHVIADEDGAVDEREAARRRVRNRRQFTRSVIAYVVVSAALIAIWAVSGAGYFWPAWVRLGSSGCASPRVGHLGASANDRGRH
jgi:2TM domain-containing protein